MPEIERKAPADSFTQIEPNHWSPFATPFLDDDEGDNVLF